MEQVYKFIRENRMFLPGERILVGVSGGADSVCLLLALLDLADGLEIERKDIYALHVNHMIRDNEAKEDESFVRDLCQKLQISYESVERNVQEYAEREGLTVEEAGRNLRYDAFFQFAMEKGCHKIAVAHNQNDLAETVLFHMLRGSGLQGMSGMQPMRSEKEKWIVRPLLSVNRTQIEDFLQRRNQEYRTDSSNLALDYDRNRIRHKILPVMQEINVQAIPHICQMAEDAAMCQREIKNAALQRYGEFSFDGNRLTLEIKRVLELPEPLRNQLLYEAIAAVTGRKKDISRNHVKLVEQLLTMDTGKNLDLPYGIYARKSYENLILEKREDFEEFCFDFESGRTFEIPEWGTFFAEIMDYSPHTEIPKKIYTKMVDYGKIKGNLCIRTPRDGDYIKIDREGKTKKLSRIFIDGKVDRKERKKWPVLACGNEIIWVPGLRYNESYRIEDNTEKVIYLRCERKGE